MAGDALTLIAGSEIDLNAPFRWNPFAVAEAFTDRALHDTAAARHQGLASHNFHSLLEGFQPHAI